VGKGKYATLIDAETWAFIERTDSWYPPETATFAVERQRQIYNAMCREFFAGYPDGVVVEDATVAGKGGDLRVRRYRFAGSDPVAQIVYFHGGGFVVGGLDSHDDVCAELCQRTGFPVTSVDYRLSPEHIHPAAFDDAMAGFRHAAATRALRVVLVGDSAGGSLCAAVCHATRSEDKSPIGQVAVYPGYGGNAAKGSYVEHAHAPMLTLADLDFYARIRTGGKPITGDPTLAPLQDKDFSGLPPTVVFSAECDPLCDDGRDYCAAIVAAGGRAKWFRETGLVHGYLRARHTVTRARDSFSRIVAAVKALGESRWPY
jgi:acetyl esterase